MPLFDDLARTDPSPASATEPSFTFLNRVGSPHWGEVRALLERWFARYPAEHADALRDSFRSPLAGKHYAAWWELYLHELFTRLGYEIEIHPELPDSARRPDFGLRRDDEQLYVEAAVVFSGIRDEESASPGWLIDAINNIRADDFTLILKEVRAETNERTRDREIQAPIEAWLATLDADDVIRSGELPAYEVDVRGWKLHLEAVPVKPEARGRDRRALGAGPIIAGWADDKDQLRSKLKIKAGRYGVPDRPFVVAVLMTSGFFDQTDAEQALYGNEVFAVWPESGESELQRKRDGFWVRRDGPQNRRVSAVLLGTAIFTSNVNRVVPELWLNPWANHPLPEDWWFPSFSVTDAGGPYRADVGSVDPAVLFELPGEWPPGKPFPRG